jgi:hypothetical protein
LQNRSPVSERLHIFLAFNFSSALLLFFPQLRRRPHDPPAPPPPPAPRRLPPISTRGTHRPPLSRPVPHAFSREARSAPRIAHRSARGGRSGWSRRAVTWCRIRDQDRDPLPLARSGSVCCADVPRFDCFALIGSRGSDRHRASCVFCCRWNRRGASFGETRIGSFVILIPRLIFSSLQVALRWVQHGSRHGGRNPGDRHG